MNHHVFFQVDFLPALISTDFTFEWSQTSMSSQVPVQMCSPRGGEIADFTQVPMFARVGLDMLLEFQFCLARKVTLFVLAVEGVPAFVFRHSMQFQVTVVDKRQVAKFTAII